MILRILPVLLLTLVLPDVYILHFHLKTSPRWSWVRPLFHLPTILLMAFSLYLVSTETNTPRNMDLIVPFFMAYMVIALPKTLFAIVAGIGQCLGRIHRSISNVCTTVATLMASALCIIMLVGFLYGPKHIVVKQQELYFTNLPASFDGYRVAQFTDLHLVSMQQHHNVVRNMVDSILAYQPNLITFTGDLVSIESRELTGFEQELGRLSAPDGVFSILGNHDYAKYARYLTQEEQEKDTEQLIQMQEQFGWKVLKNSHQIIQHEEDSIAIIGVENYGKPPFPQLGDLGKAFEGLQIIKETSPSSDKVFKILLSHDPTHWDAEVVGKTNIDLTLSGHTHGMQFMIGGWSPSALFYPKWKGLHEQNGQKLYISLGVGGALIPFRFGAWPEINIITLRRIK